MIYDASAIKLLPLGYTVQNLYEDFELSDFYHERQALTIEGVSVIQAGRYEYDPYDTYDPHDEGPTYWYAPEIKVSLRKDGLLFEYRDPPNMKKEHIKHGRAWIRAGIFRNLDDIGEFFDRTICLEDLNAVIIEAGHTIAASSIHRI